MCYSKVGVVLILLALPSCVTTSDFEQYMKKHVDAEEIEFNKTLKRISALQDSVSALGHEIEEANARLDAASSKINAVETVASLIDLQPAFSGEWALSEASVRDFVQGVLGVETGSQLSGTMKIPFECDNLRITPSEVRWRLLVGLGESKPVFVTSTLVPDDGTESWGASSFLTAEIKFNVSTRPVERGKLVNIVVALTPGVEQGRLVMKGEARPSGREPVSFKFVQAAKKANGE